MVLNCIELAFFTFNLLFENETADENEALAGLNEMLRMGWRCSTELYAEMLMAVK